MSDPAFSGSVNIAAQIGVNAVLIRPMRGLSLFNQAVANSSLLLTPQVVIEEEPTDTLTITEHPVEFGSNISDHAFKRPAEVTLKYGWSNSPTPSLIDSLVGIGAGAVGGAVATVAGLAQSSLSGFNVGVDSNGVQASQINKIYDQLLQLQSSRTLIAIYTGRRFYQNMLIQQLSPDPTDFTTENALIITLRCKQIIIAKTSVVSLPQADASATGPVIQDGTRQTIPR